MKSTKQQASTFLAIFLTAFFLTTLSLNLSKANAQAQNQANAQVQSNWQLDTIQINGIKQVVASKGKSNGPIILFLHGGPGSSKMRQADNISDQLQKEFMVVQWDQRETGMTLALNKTQGPISLEMMVQDTKEVIDALLKKYKQQKLYLAGESWGTVLGFKMAEQYAQKLHAYLAFVPVTNQNESERLLLKTLKEEAKGGLNSQPNPQALRELNTIKIPFQNADDVYYLRKWWFAHEGTPFADKDTAAVKDYLKGWSDIWLPTWKAVMHIDFTKELPKVDCPIYFFLGGKDYQTNSSLAKAYYEKLSAPKKNIYWFEDASHDLLVTETAKVQLIILKEILKK